MAKSKKKNKQLKLLFVCLEVVLLIVAIAMIAVNAITGNLLGSQAKGYEVVFGNDFLNFSFMNLLTYLLVVAGLVLLVLKLAMPKQAKLLNLVAVLVLIIAGVFFFLTNQFTIFASSYVDAGKAYSLSAGPIVSGIVTLVAAVTACLETFLAD